MSMSVSTEAMLGKTAMAGRLEPLARAFLADAPRRPGRAARAVYCKASPASKGIATFEAALSNSGNPQRW